MLLIGGTVPRNSEEIIQLLRACVNGDSSYFGTVPSLIEQDDGPISTILIEAGELELLALIRRLTPQRREERERGSLSFSQSAPTEAPKKSPSVDVASPTRLLLAGRGR